MQDAPALRYYRSLQGAWSGAFSFEVTSFEGLRGAPTSAARKVPLALLGLFSRIVGPARIETTLRARDPASRVFLHTTRVSKLGVVGFETTEEISVNDDGQTFHLTGQQRPWGPMGPSEGYEADGEIDATGTRATYRIPWSGADLIQRTAVVPEGLELSQETAWSRAHVLLRRVPSPPENP